MRFQNWLLALFLTAAASSLTLAQQATPDDSAYEYSSDWTTPHTKLWMRHLARFSNKPDVHGLEIGCFEGRSSIWFLERIASHPTARMTCIDVFTESIEKRFDHNLRVSGLSERMIKRKGYSQDVLRTLASQTFDFVYIDGCHLASCVLTDAVLAWDLLRPGGMIIFDDYLWELEKPKTQRPKLAIDTFVAIFHDELRVRAKAYQVIVEKKKKRAEKVLIGEPVVHTQGWEERYQQKKKEARENH